MPCSFWHDHDREHITAIVSPCSPVIVPHVFFPCATPQKDVRPRGLPAGRSADARGRRRADASAHQAHQAHQAPDSLTRRTERCTADMPCRGRTPGPARHLSFALPSPGPRTSSHISTSTQSLHRFRGNRPSFSRQPLASRKGRLFGQPLHEGTGICPTRSLS